ncbi:hypothetical protein FGL88_03590 [Weissella soli]|nr:hypothetical protein FGL88_03590 [Weissella soli]
MELIYLESGRRMINKLKEMYDLHAYQQADARWARDRQAEATTPAEIAKRYYDVHYSDWQVRPNTFLYEMQDGNELDDAPFVLLRTLLKTNPKATHTIIINKDSLKKAYKVLAFWELTADPRIKVVDRFTEAHMRTLLTAETVITNAMIFSDIFVKRARQRFVNTWHGTPWKKMGYAMPGGVMGSWNVVRTLMMTDLLVMPNTYTAKIFNRDYRLAGLYLGKITTIGYPRNDVFFEKLSERQLTTLEKDYRNGQPTILYAPTWAGDASSAGDATDELTKYLHTLVTLSQHFPTYTIRFKPHSYFTEAINADARFAPFLVDDAWGTNVLLAHTDILITDYSSLFFDFLVTGRPVLFYDTQIDYDTRRGKYFEVDELPGPFTHQLTELMTSIENIAAIKTQYAAQYAKFVTRFVRDDDGSAARRVTEVMAQITSQNQHGQVVVNGEDFSDGTFGLRHQIADLATTYDTSMAIYEAHLLDNWYGFQFFQNIDGTMPNTRIFVNKQIPNITLTLNEATQQGHRFLGNVTFEVALIPQVDFSSHQQALITTANTVVTVTNTERDAWLDQLGFTKIAAHADFVVWSRDENFDSNTLSPIFMSLQ